MPSNEKNPLPSPPIRLGWTTVTSLLAALAAVGGVALHLIGAVSHQIYLNHWGIDAGLFPKATDWILINGYYSLFNQFVVILTGMMRIWYLMLAAALLLGLYVFALRLPLINPPKWLLRLPAWCLRMFEQLLLTTLVVSGIPLVLFLLTVFMVIPVELGKQAGEAAAKASAVEHSKGCEKSKYQCVQLTKNGDLIATGFVLDDSPAQIAIFDTEHQRGRTIPRDGLEMMSSRASLGKTDKTP